MQTLKKKKLIIFLLFLTFGFGLNKLEAVVAVQPVAKEDALILKEIHKAKKQEKKTKKLEKMLEKVQKKADRKAKKNNGTEADRGLSDLDKNLRLAIVFGIAAVATSIVAALISSSFLWWFVTPLWIVGLVFLILWLINDA